VKRNGINAILVGLLISITFSSLAGCGLAAIDINEIRISYHAKIFTKWPPRGKPLANKIPLNLGLYINPDFEYFKVKRWKGIELWHYDGLGMASAKQFQLELNNIFCKVELIYPFPKNIWPEMGKEINAIIEPRIETFYCGRPFAVTGTWKAKIKYEIILYDINRNIIFKRSVEGVGDFKGRIRNHEGNAGVAGSKAIEDGVSRAIEAILASQELMAVVKANKGQCNQAMSDFNEALEIDPRFAQTYNNRGIAYVSKGQYDKAISDYNRALQINSRYAEAYNNRGIAYHNKGQYDQAISDYNRALEIDPRDAVPYYNRGIAYYSKKEYDKSWEDVKKAQDLGLKVSPKFLEDLRKASGRQN